MRSFFPHEYNARNDEKMVMLQIKYGMIGLGTYWSVLEMLYEESGYIYFSRFDRISFELRTDKNIIMSIIKDFDLFSYDNDKFWSEGCLRRLEFIKTKSKTASETANRRWSKHKNTKMPSQEKTNTDEMQKDNESNANALHEHSKVLKNETLSKSDVSVSDEMQKYNESNANALHEHNKTDTELDKSNAIKQHNIKQHNIKENNDVVFLEKFDAFRKIYPGKKRGNYVEFTNFQKRHKDWKTLIDTLKPSLEKQIEANQKNKQAGGFVPNWKDFSRYVNGRFWEEEIPITAHYKNESPWS